jgi:hypothetical protein
MLSIEYAKDPIWGSENGDRIILTVKFEQFADEMPFGATSFDIEPHGIELFNRAKAGEFGVVAPYVAPEQPTVQGAQTL